MCRVVSINIVWTPKSLYSLDLTSPSFEACNSYKCIENNVGISQTTLTILFKGLIASSGFVQTGAHIRNRGERTRKTYLQLWKINAKESASSESNCKYFTGRQKYLKVSIS